MLVMPRTLMTVSEPLTRTSLPVVYKERAGRLPGSCNKQTIVYANRTYPDVQGVLGSGQGYL